MEKKPSLFDRLKRSNSTSRWRFESGPTLSIQTAQFVFLEYLVLSVSAQKWKCYLAEAQIILQFWSKEAVNLHFSILKI